MNIIYASKDDKVEPREIEHKNLSRKLAAECMVLLENDGTLPLRSTGNIALFGNGARNTIKGGTGSGDVNTRDNVNIEMGFEKAGFRITTKEWLNRQEKIVSRSKAEYEQWLHTEAEKTHKNPFIIQFDYPYKEPETAEITAEDCCKADTDTAVYIISRNSGEGADRYDQKGDYRLQDMEKKNLLSIVAHFKKTIVVLNIGGVMDLSEILSISGIGAVLLMGQLGNIGGDALLDIMTGKVNPSGKTTDTWAKSYNDYPSSAQFSHNNGNVNDEYYEDGIYVGYRYFDTFHVGYEYCFGYGLSYTDFDICCRKAELKGNQLKLEIEVTNSGEEFSGKETVQVYYSAPSTQLDKPLKELVAFKKTRTLAPKENEILELSFFIENMSSYDSENASWMLEKGDYYILLGNSSQTAENICTITVSDSVVVEEVKNICPLDCDLKEIKSEYEQRERLRQSIQNTSFQIAFDAKKVQKRKHSYTSKRQTLQNKTPHKLTMNDLKKGECTIQELVSQLTVEEMAYLCVGMFNADNNSIVGNNSGIVPGAAGDTSSDLWETRKIKSMILADGPAGLRLQPHFKADKEGNLLKGGSVLGDIVIPFEESLNQEEVDNYYQYCTAIPIGWSLAQSWNVDLVEEIGEMVGLEMEQFHVDLWLAPALNIHRNPLCGRNFEYYSEDPLVSGKIASAMTKGVQSRPGKGTTIKHFAVNNQEDNRYFINAHVSERALREIYLKGFEITVKESSPLSIMTSYNLINGIHAANNKDLLQTVVRDEWGFDGMVMTDWFTSQNITELTGKFKPIYPISASSGCIYASNDLQMPGCQKNVDDIIQSITNQEEVDGYLISLGDLQYCTANIIGTILKTM